MLLLSWAIRPILARAAVTRTDPTETSSPYLRATGPLTLRIQPPPVEKESSARPAASGPPFPMPDSAPAATTNASAEVAAKPAAQDVILPAAPAAAPTPPPIIPDDTRPRVQAEDFLPYFHFPSPAERPVVLPPNPPHHATPSTATYRQQ